MHTTILGSVAAASTTPTVAEGMLGCRLYHSAGHLASGGCVEQAWGLTANVKLQVGPRHAAHSHMGCW
jgi:hypothetical protein